MKKIGNFLAIAIAVFSLFHFVSDSAYAAGILPTGSGSGWQFQAPVPQGNDVLAAWAASPDDLYVGGHGGVVLHWDGSQWTMMNTPTQKTIFAIHGTGPNDVWAVGGDGYTLNNMGRSLIMHYDGSAWTLLQAPDFSGYTYVLNAVHAIAPNNVWACIDGGTAVLHWDGSQWSFEYPSLSLEGNFYAVTAVGSDHVFFSGSYGQIVHYDAGTWVLEQKLESGTISMNLIQKLWAADLDTVYAGGNWGQVYRRNSDGSWTDLEFPTGWGEDNTIRYLWGTSATDIYLMGNTSIRHYDGVNPPVRYDFAGTLRRQWLNGAGAVDRIFGVGPNGEVDQFVLDGLGGGALSPMIPTSDRIGFGIRLSGSVGYGDQGFVAYGNSVYIQDPYPMLLYNGTTVAPFPELPPGMNSESMVSGAIATGPESFVISWDNFITFGNGVHQWDGSAWTQLGQPYEAPIGINQFWQSPEGALYASYPSGVAKWDGSVWSTLLDYTASITPTCIWGRAEDEIYVGTEDGKITRYDGAAWQMENTPADKGRIISIAGNETETYAVGENGLALYRVAGSWGQMAAVEERDGDNFGQIIVTSNELFVPQTTNSLYVGGGLGRIWQFFAGNAGLILEGLSQPLEAMALTHNDTIYGIAPLDFIIKREPTRKPAPLIKANGQNGLVIVPVGDPVSISISLDPGDFAGANADWWVAVHTPFDPPGDWYTYVHPAGWMPGVNLCAQTPLFAYSGFEVLDMILPSGSYTFYFAVDAPDGAVTADLLDSVEVTVE